MLLYITSIPPELINTVNLDKLTSDKSATDAEQTGSTENISYLYLINNSFRVLIVGHSIVDWNNTLIEGEYIEHKRAYYAYDILYAKGLDIRNKPLESFNKQQSSRLKYLNDFNTDLQKSNIEINPDYIYESNNQKIPMTISVQLKPYLFGNESEIFTKSKELWDNREKQDYHVDGLIYIPATEPYPSRVGRWDKLFKWKPPHLNTIDFLIKTVKNKNNKDILYPYIANPNSEESQHYEYIKQYKSVELYVSGNNDTDESMNKSVESRRIPVLFDTTKIPVDGNGRMLAFDPLSNESEELFDDMIIECSYTPYMSLSADQIDFKWIPIRVRHDKTHRYKKHKDEFGNDEKIAKDILKSINNPLTEEIITTGNITVNMSDYKKTGGSKNNQPFNDKIVDQNILKNVKYTSASEVKKDRLAYQLFHTVYIKDILLKKTSVKVDSSKSTHLIDFGSSRGGDMNRWNQFGYKTVVGIDLDPDSIRQATDRYVKSKYNKQMFKVSFVCGNLTMLIFPEYECAYLGGEFKENMKLAIPNKYMFDVVSSQFMIHYSFENEINVKAYFQNVVDNLKIGGYFVGTTFDGERLYNDLQKNKVLTGYDQSNEKLWEIKKLYGTKKFNIDKPSTGLKIDVYVKSIGLPHPEYLVNYKYMIDIAESFGLKLIEIRPFSDYWEEASKLSDSPKFINEMTNDEKQFSFYFSSFIFEKVKNVPLSNKLNNQIKKNSNKNLNI
jgi:hypothetical protein